MTKPRPSPDELVDSLRWLGRALTVDAEYLAGGSAPILRELARILLAVGVDEFVAAWAVACPGQDPPLTEIGSAMGDVA